MQKLRLVFEKTGSAAYISHLDLVRAVSRAFSRAEIRVRHTEGFNPHPKLVFCNPLSLGYESLAEICDFELGDGETLSPQAIYEMLSPRMPSGLGLKSVAERERPLSDIAFAGYKITFSDTKELNKEAVERLFSGDTLIVSKKSKSGERDTDIMPLIRALSVTSLPEGLQIECVLAFSPGESLNPDNITKAIGRYLGASPEVSYLKTAVYDGAGENFI